MAYFNQERKKAMQPRIKAILDRYGMKGSLSVDHHSTVVLTLTAGKLNFEFENEDRRHLSVNPYWFKEHFKGEQLEFLTEVFAVLNDGNWDRSDSQVDYFDVGWYVDVNVGRWNKPYVCTKPAWQLPA